MEHRLRKDSSSRKDFVQPKKSLGQNFLVNPGILEKIISSSKISIGDVVLEIGPGRGVLTRRLSEGAGHVIAIEKDHRLIEDLRKEFLDKPSVEIVEGDILEFKIESLKLEAGKYKVVANIPYYITSHLLKTIFEKWPIPELIVLLVQKEVAQRICARTGDLNLLALSVQYYAEPEIIGTVSRGSFRPMPNVDSSIIRLTPHAPSQDELQTKIFFELIKSGFANKRKQLLNTLSKAFPEKKPQLAECFESLGLKPEIRPQDVSLETWKRLSSMLTKRT